MTEAPQIDAISGISEPEKIRVVIFINGRLLHVPLNALIKHLQDQIDALEARVDALETP